jgi:excinuclease ABC subunit C
MFLPANSPGLLLLMRLRDEAHRFAVSFHRKKARDLALQSILTQVPGLGPKRRRLLLTHFTDIAALSRASLEELLVVPGLPRTVAENLLAVLREKEFEKQQPVKNATSFNRKPETGNPKLS